MIILVNEALDRLGELDGRCVKIYGLLSLQFEGRCITHLPVAERGKSGVGSGFRDTSGIWVDFNPSTVRFSEKELLPGYRMAVVVKGVLSNFGSRGCGHFSLWSAGIYVSEIVRCEAPADIALGNSRLLRRRGADFDC